MYSEVLLPALSRAYLCNSKTSKIFTQIISRYSYSRLYFYYFTTLLQTEYATQTLQTRSKLYVPPLDCFVCAVSYEHTGEEEKQAVPEITIITATSSDIFLVLFLYRGAARCFAAGVILLAQLGVDLTQQVLRERAQQLPGEVQRLENRPVLVPSLRDELSLELLNELDEQVVLLRQRLLAHHRLHGHHVLAARVGGVQLVGHRAVVLARHALADGALHQAGQRWQHVDGREDLFRLKLPVQVDLALRDVSGQIWDRVGDIIVGHGEDRKLGDRTVAADDSTGPLIDGG
jgi:hypothetical protein